MKYDSLILNFQRFMSQLRRHREVVAADLNLPSRCITVLSALYRYPEPITRLALADSLGLGSNALGRPINRLLELDLISRDIDPNNRRCIHLSLTPSGKTLAKQYRQRMTKVWQLAMRESSKNDRKRFIAQLDQMASQLKDTL